jgi:energy-coupling factor transport system substrate-specific component
VPVICSFLFGPAAAWGSAIGNLIGDLFGGLGPGDAFGFAGNFLYGLIPYRAWEAIDGGDPVPDSIGGWIRLLFVIALAAAACALVVGWGLNTLGFVPFPVLANVVLLNNLVTASILAPLVLRVLYPRVRSGGLLYVDLVPGRPNRSRASVAWLAATATFTIGGHIAGNLIYTGRWVPPWVAMVGFETANRSFEIGFGLLPFVALVFACALRL